MEQTLTPRDNALKNLGRTIVNFQRLEHCLKLLAKLRPMNGTISKIQRDLEKHAEKTSGFTLGQAINAWLETLDGYGPDQPVVKDLFDVTLKSEIEIDIAPEIKAVHAEQLRSLLTDRNGLIHGGLVEFDWDSPGECKDLAGSLDVLNEAIGEQIDFLHSIIKGVGSLSPEEFRVVEGESRSTYILSEIKGRDA